jgi:hypothetical protein
MGSFTPGSDHTEEPGSLGRWEGDPVRSGRRHGLPIGVWEAAGSLQHGVGPGWLSGTHQVRPSRMEVESGKRVEAKGSLLPVEFPRSDNLTQVIDGKSQG